MTRTAPTLCFVFLLCTAPLTSGCLGTLGEGGVVEGDVSGGEPEPVEADRQSLTSYALPLNVTVEVCRVNYGVNNRSGPSTSYAIQRVLLLGTRVQTLDRDGNWYKVAVDGVQGWSYGLYLCTTANEVTTGDKVKVCHVQVAVNNRSGPSTSYPVIRTLPLGTVARTLARSGHWLKLRVYGVDGWSHDDYLCPTSDPLPPQPCTSCGSGGGTLLSPPNFDPANVVGGYVLLPQSQPSGLYTRKADACSRGTKRLIDVLYTAAKRFQPKWPALAPISYLDLNEGSCSTVNHQTHDDGTHADIVAGCATSTGCSDIQPAVDLAKALVDTGELCGIIFDDAAVGAQINAYFASKYSYTPWHGQLMRSIGGHTGHFHIRVKKPDGSCN